MKLEKQLIMTIGMTNNNWELTREMVENSLNTFTGKPIVWNKEQNFKDYSDMKSYYIDNKIIGIIAAEPDSKIIIEDNNVYADIWLFEKFDGDKLWKGKSDNWCITIADDWKSFILDSIEVF